MNKTEKEDRKLRRFHLRKNLLFLNLDFEFFDCFYDQIYDLQILCQIKNLTNGVNLHIFMQKKENMAIITNQIKEILRKWTHLEKSIYWERDPTIGVLISSTMSLLRSETDGYKIVSLLDDLDTFFGTILETITFHFEVDVGSTPS